MAHARRRELERWRDEQHVAHRYQSLRSLSYCLSDVQGQHFKTNPCIRIHTEGGEPLAPLPCHSKSGE